MNLVLSATQIETFDPSTTWGCNRKWYFGWVRKIKGPPDKSLVLGDAVHQTIEQYLLTGNQGVLHDVALPGVPNLIRYRPRVKLIEHKIPIGDFEIAGVPIVGKIDAVAPGHPFELIDWKTTSSIARYAKTKGELQKSIQMNLYAAYLYEFFSELELEEMIYTLGYFGTKKREHDLVSVPVAKRENDQCILTIEDTVSKMVTVAAETDLEKVAPNEAVCNIGFGCPHRAYCPRAGSFNMASLLDSFFKSSPGGVADADVQPVAPVEPAAPAVSVTPEVAVLPPDAAPREQKVRKSLIVELENPAATHEVVSTIANPPAVSTSDAPAGVAQVGPPVEVINFDKPKGKGGRPKGSKNKPKDFSPLLPAPSREGQNAQATEGKGEAPGPTAGTPAASPVPDGATPSAGAIPDPKPTPRVNIGNVRVNSLSIRHAAKFGMPDFSSINVEVEAGGDVTGDASKAREELSMYVKACMIKEMDLYVKKAEEQLKKKAEEQAAKQGAKT